MKQNANIFITIVIIILACGQPQKSQAMQQPEKILREIVSITNEIEFHRKSEQPHVIDFISKFTTLDAMQNEAKNLRETDFQYVSKKIGDLRERFFHVSLGQVTKFYDPPEEKIKEIKSMAEYFEEKTKYLKKTTSKKPVASVIQRLPNNIVSYINNLFQSGLFHSPLYTKSSKFGYIRPNTLRLVLDKTMSIQNALSKPLEHLFYNSSYFLNLDINQASNAISNC